jgi:flavin reductase (DIM6/NTAB) family NADH-FMN oxidoreductase RutF
MDFVELDIAELQFNPFEMIGTDWMLVAAGNDSAFDMMTASWGELGYRWGQPVANIHVRPGVYTKQFIDNTDDFSLCFFGEDWREVLEFCGENSGEDVDKVKETGLTPVAIDDTIAFDQAELIITCHKIYKQEVDPAGFVDNEIPETLYPDGAYDTTYVGRVNRILIAADLMEEADDDCGCGHDHEHGESCSCGHEH